MNESGHKPPSDQLKDFGDRLGKTLEAQRKTAGPDKTEGSAAGLAMRAVTELMVGLGVSLVGGIAADRYFGTAPWIMLALMPFGLAAGVANVMRLSNSRQAKEVFGEGKPPAPSVKDDDED